MVAWYDNTCDFSCGLHKWANYSFSLCQPFSCDGIVQHLIYSELDAADCAQLEKKDLELVL